MRALVVTLGIALSVAALAAPASAGKVAWKPWTPPGGCEAAADATPLSGLADLLVLHDDDSAKAVFPEACDPGVSWKRHRLVRVTYTATNAVLTRVKTVRTARRGGRKLIKVVVEAQRVCRGYPQDETTVRWVRIPAGSTPVDVEVVWSKKTSRGTRGCPRLP